MRRAEHVGAVVEGVFQVFKGYLFSHGPQEKSPVRKLRNESWGQAFDHLNP